MNLPENDNQTNDQQQNDDGLDQTTPNDNQQLDRINEAVQAAEPSFTLSYENGIPGEVEKSPDQEDEDGPNIKQ